MTIVSTYPEFHHPCFFLVSALKELGADAEFAKDQRTLDCWGMTVNGKIVVYLIDNRHMHERAHEDPAATELLQRGTLVCSAQKPDAERIGAKWLPLAVTPGYRTPNKPIHKTHDVAFVGYLRDMARANLLTDIAARFTLFTGQGLFGDDAIEAYWSAKVALNIPTQYGDPNCYDVNMRVFEALATGTPLLTNWLPALEELGIQSSIHCLTYTSADELFIHIKSLIDAPNWAKTMGEKGAMLVQERHTYRHRAKQILEWLK